VSLFDNLYGTPDLLELPPTTWLVEGVLPENGFIGLWGPPGAGKSFVAIDIALSIAAGIPWQGHALTPGPVLYISAEGGRGIGKRVQAWLQAHDIEAAEADALWLLSRINASDDSDDMQELVELVGDFEAEQNPGESEPWRPVLIVVDTLARCFVGNENEQEDMGSFVRAIDRLRETFKCAVLIIHHARLDGDRERGNTAFRGAADTMIRVEKDADYITLTCDKQRDAEDFPSLTMQLTSVEHTDSCVLNPWETSK